MKGGGFESFGLSLPVFRAIKYSGYRVPTPIQRKAIPIALNGNDLAAMARTGSGKTAAFLIPLFERLGRHGKKGVRGLVISPSRELALQTLSFIKKLGKYMDLRTAVLIGGESMERDYEAISQSPDVIVCTPGRLIHHLDEIPEFTLKSVEYCVFDEADRLFEMGFADQLHNILEMLPENRQTLLFSATLPRVLADFTKVGLKDPEVVRLDVENRLSEDLWTAFFLVSFENKLAGLLLILNTIIPKDQQAMIFVASRHHAEYINEVLRALGIVSCAIYGSMDQTARNMSLAAFRDRKVSVAVVTDVAARGLDIPYLDNVINYDFPPKPKIFIHRVGRVARAGRSGNAFSLSCSDDLPFMIDLHLFLGHEVKSGCCTNPKVARNSENSFVFGSVPASMIDDENETLSMIHERKYDLKTLKKTAMNAEKAYRRSRPVASGESVRRAKGIASVPAHPLFVSDESNIDGTREQQAFLESLKSFRPAASVLEGGTKGHLFEAGRKAAAEEKEPESETMPKTELMTTSATTDISSSLPVRVKSKRKNRPIANDNDINLSYLPSRDKRPEYGEDLEITQEREKAGHSIIEQAVMDLVPEDAKDILKKRSVMRWDRKRKRFVQSTGGLQDDRAQKKVNESGVAVSEKKRRKSSYSEWKRSNMHRLTNQSDGDQTKLLNAPSRFAHKGREKKSEGKDGHNSKEELRNIDQITKIRRKKARAASRVKRGKDRKMRKGRR